MARSKARHAPHAPTKRKHERGRPADADARKQQLLTKKTPSIQLSIADAVTVKDGDVYFVCQHGGDVPAADGHGFGLYYHDCRFLNVYELAMGGHNLEVLASAARSGFEAVMQLTNPELRVEGRHIPKETVGVLWTRLIRGERQALYDRFEIVNYGTEPVDVPLVLKLDADFKDIFDIRGLLECQPGKRLRPRWIDDTLVFAYEGADGICRALHVNCEPAPDERRGCEFAYRIALAPGERRHILVTLAVAEQRETPPEPKPERADMATVSRWLGEASHAWVAGRLQLVSDAPLFNQVFRQCFLDLHTLRSRIDREEYFAAGVPWYTTLFGRDSLITALQTLAYDPEIAAQTLRLLAKYQGKDEDAWRDEEPGKILHELRLGELARLDEIPHTPYYGSIDSTPLFLIVVARHAAWTGNLMLFHELRGNVDAALAWIDHATGRDENGYLAYTSNVDRGLINQGWKDSGDAIVNANGSLATPPIALVEVQGYVYLAKMEIADLFERAGEATRAKRLRREAETLRASFNRDYWLAGRQFFALARQAGGQPAAVIASNPGQALWTGIVDEEKAEPVVRRLMSDDMFSGWGVRTLSSEEDRYNPIGYHLGTVWPHDNGLIAAGCRRYGFDDEALRIFNGIFGAATHFDLYRMPEVFSGFSREPYGEPVRYPVACHPQAWAAGTLPHLMTTLLGLRPDGFACRLHVCRPMLPAFVDTLTLTRLRVGAGTVDLRFERHGSRVGVEVACQDGEVDVVVHEREPGGQPGKG